LLTYPTSAEASDKSNIKQKIGTTTGGERHLKRKKYPTSIVNGKKVKNVPAEDILMKKVVSTPTAPKNVGTSIRISLADQRAWLFEHGKPVLVSSITPGKKTSPTPKGKFHIINKHRHWTSTIYNVPMPYFLRLNPGYFGLHQGQMKTTPASHGCIRLPQKEASEFFQLAKVGDPVWIE
jgi:lipoprotein-anchoring transpeptidase ErfK/SrfK